MKILRIFLSSLKNYLFFYVSNKHFLLTGEKKKTASKRGLNKPHYRNKKKTKKEKVNDSARQRRRKSQEKSVQCF